MYSSKTTPYQDLIPEAILLEHVFRLPNWMRAGLAFFFLTLLAVPLYFVVLKDDGKFPDFIFYFFAFIPGILNLLLYKKRYFFTNSGIWIIDKEKRELDKSTAPRQLLIWKDYAYYRKSWIGFTFFKKTQPDNNEKTKKIEILMQARKTQFIFCSRDKSRHIEFFIMGRNIIPVSMRPPRIR